MGLPGGQPLPAGFPYRALILSHLDCPRITHCQAISRTVARGIHLKQLKSADLRAIGVPNEGSGETSDDEDGHPLGLLVEADPVLSQTLDEVRQGLEATRSFLDEALRAIPPPLPPA